VPPLPGRGPEEGAIPSVPGRITVGVRPKSQLCEPVVTRLPQN
jgi:hypothetical protein